MLGGILSIAGALVALWLVRESDIERSEPIVAIVGESAAAVADALENAFQKSGVDGERVLEDVGAAVSQIGFAFGTQAVAPVSMPPDRSTCARTTARTDPWRSPAGRPS